MDFIRLGNSGLKITEITFGSALTIGTENNNISYAKSLVDKAWELGIRSFDTSNNYGYGNAEKLLSEALKTYNRDEYVVSTKGSWPIGESVYHKGLSRKHILWAIEESLKRMNLDYVDIYYAHRYDPEVPMSEIVRTFNYLISIGKIRYWATSEWPIEALEECHKVCDELKLEKPIIEQCIYSYAVRKCETNGVKDFCDKNGVGMLGFSPLCQGILTGKYREGIPVDSRIAKKDKINYNKTENFYQQNKETIEKFFSVCDRYNVRPVDVAIRWCIEKHIYPVLGASKPEQLEDSLKNYKNDKMLQIIKEL